jgi:hypothetical protein
VRYNQKFWGARLPRWPVKQVDLAAYPALGRIEETEKVIKIDVAANRTDAEVRSTLLHEMAHLAGYSLERAKVGHNSAFFTHVERLLKLGAPIRVSSAENQGRAVLESVPSRFRRCRAAMRAEYDRKARWLARGAKEAASRGARVMTLNLSAQFYELGEAGWRWPNAIRTLDSEFGLLDIDGRVLSAFAPQGAGWRSAHRRGQRDRRQRARQNALWSAAGASSPTPAGERG